MYKNLQKVKMQKGFQFLFLCKSNITKSVVNFFNFRVVFASTVGRIFRETYITFKALNVLETLFKYCPYFIDCMANMSRDKDFFD